MKSITLRPAQAEDTEFLFRVYASTRSEELARTPWTEDEKRAFLEMQFNAQEKDYSARFPGGYLGLDSSARRWPTANCLRMRHRA